MMIQHSLYKVIYSGLFLIFSSTSVCLSANIETAPAKNSAQNPVKIVAVVGNAVISDYDLEERTKFTLLSSSIPDTAENRTKFQPKILDMMIEEQLKRQEATKLDIKNTPKEISEAINNIEEKNNIPKNSLEKQLADAGLDANTFRGQVDADLLWLKYVRATLWHTINITDKEVESVQKSLEPASDQNRYNLSEIFLPVSDPEQANEVYDIANDILAQLHEGANFAAIALQFSRGPQAYKGGEIGWVIEDVLNKETLAALKTLPVGEISLPVRTPDGYHIFLLNDKQVSSKTRQFELAKVTVPAKYKETHPDFADKLTSQTTCQNFLKQGAKASTDGTGMLGLTTITALPESIQKLLTDLPEGKISKPLSTEEKDVFFMICKDQTGTKGNDMPSPEQIKERLTGAKAETLSQRKLREIRKNTIIEKRI